MTDRDPYLFPKLRWPIDLKFEKVQDSELLVLRCPLGVAAQPLILIPAVGPLLAHFDGTKSVSEIAQKFSSFGVNEELIKELVGILDQSLFLKSPRFSGADQRMRDEFANARVREAFLAGASYESDPAKLGAELEQYLQYCAPASAAGGDLAALVAPHIDYRRGQVCYGLTYNYLRDQNPDLYVLIGTSHQYSDHMFHLSAKDFASPLALLPCDIEFVQALARRYGAERSFADEFLHRREHSLELQLPFISHLKGGVRIAPILVGSFYEMLSSGRAPASFDQYESFAAALAEVCAARVKQGQRVVFIAGVDMAHVGKFFGDPGALSAEFMQQVEARDRIYLDTIMRRDKDAMFAHIEEDRDARRICGFPTMYTLLDVFERLGISYQARLFDYRQAVDYVSDCAVTFAGMGLYKT